MITVTTIYVLAFLIILFVEMMKNNFEIIKYLNFGATCKAFLAKEKSTNKVCVFKTFNLENDKFSEEKILKEVELFKSLDDHPNVVKYITSFKDKEDHTFHIVMDYVDGGDLLGKIKRFKEYKCRIPDNIILDYFFQILKAVEYIHSKKVIHRDIKPSNIFLNSDGTIKLGDFGISRSLQSTQELAHTQIGTPLYLSPEIFEGKEYNNKVDIWGLGCILYELCTLKHAFDAQNIYALGNRVVSGDLNEIPEIVNEVFRNLIESMLVIDPEERPSAKEILSTPIFDSIKQDVSPIIAIQISNHSCSVAIHQDNSIVVVQNEYQSRSTLLCFYFSDNSKDIYIGKTAKEMLHETPKNFVYDIMKILGKDYDDVKEKMDQWGFDVVDGGKAQIRVIYNNEQVDIYPERLLAILIKEMKRIAELYLNDQKVKYAVITIPALFYQEQKISVNDAANMAGLMPLRVIENPICSIDAYINARWERITKENINILVFDFGRELEISLVNIDFINENKTVVNNNYINNNYNYFIKAIESDEYIGGDLIDQIIFEHFAKIILEKHQFDVKSDPIQSKYLLSQCESAKRQLSSLKHAKIYWQNQQDEFIQEDFKRKDFKRLIQTAIVDVLEGHLTNILRKANMSKENVDEILLSGGSSHIVCVKKMIKRYFGKEPYSGICSDYIALNGAAKIAAKLENQKKHENK